MLGFFKSSYNFSAATTTILSVELKGLSREGGGRSRILMKKIDEYLQLIKSH